MKAYLENLIIYRTSDRPKYMEITFPHLLENTEGPAHVFVVDNSSTPIATEQNKEIFDRYKLMGSSLLESYFISAGRPLRCNGAVAWGIAEARRVVGQPENVFVVDDDCLVPETVWIGDSDNEYCMLWDTVLRAMLREGWDIVGHPYQDMIHDYKKLPTEKVGAAKGKSSTFVSPACSAFKYELYQQRPWTKGKKELVNIFYYNEWQRQWHKDGKRIGYSAEELGMMNQHIDSPDHPLSLRDADYSDYSDEIWWQKTNKRTQKRPKGVR